MSLKKSSACFAPSVYGVGILGTKYQSSVNGVQTKEHGLAVYGHDAPVIIARSAAYTVTPTYPDSG